MSLTLHIEGVTDSSNTGNFTFSGTSSSMGDLTGTVTGTQGFSGLFAILSGAITGTGSISGPFTGTISATVNPSSGLSNIVFDINIA